MDVYTPDEAMKLCGADYGLVVEVTNDPEHEERFRSL